MSIDPRLMERRKTVAEHNAKRNVTRLLKFLALCLVAASIVWLLFSPWLSIREVETSGISVSATHSILAETGVVAGTPTVSIRTGTAEAALLEDPWIAEANVTVHWPDRVVVTVKERTPLAWVRTSGGWSRRAIDGTALPSGETPDEAMAWIDLPDLADEDALGSAELAGSLEFVESLPARRHQGAVVTMNEGELWADVAGHQVRLGRAVEMREKALSLDALLDETIPVDSVLVLIAPTNPAVMTPTPDEV
ncbi:MAG: FtsQ-type POTRA domain-containing protein, partial [Acidimicrobiia bacterium]